MPITALGFLAVFSIGCLVALKRPYVGLLLYFFVFYMHPPGKYWGAYIPELRWTFIVALITLMSTFMHEKNKSEWLTAKSSKYLLAFLAFVAAQTPFAISPSWHSEYLVLLIKVVLLYFLIITIVNSKKRLIWVIMTNIAGAGYIGLNALQTHSGGRFENAGLPSIEDSNLLAIHMLPILMMGAFVFLSEYFKKYNYLIFIPLAFIGNLIIMTGSRGAIGALAVAGFSAMFFATKDFRGRLLKWAIVALLAISTLSINMIIDRFESMTADEEGQIQERSAASRMVIINAQIEMFKTNLIIGGGHRTTLLLSPYYIPTEYLTKTALGGVRGSHNLTMSIFTDHGIIGGFLYFMLVLTCLFTALRIIKDRDYSNQNRLIALGLLSGYMGVLAASQFSNSKVMEISIWMFAFITAFDLMLKKKAKE
ncbi:O-antigen ligase family protein [Psychrosphaera aestuarii]|uniref:O-antigen ligase family protein n=1 Tax=Psychrosphaera aestuarii TaxID=1266052 RepID=UPI001B33E676|nr:O-antigen ligase family protein [Psychrosphaera aestuarii]